MKRVLPAALLLLVATATEPVLYQASRVQAEIRHAFALSEQVAEIVRAQAAPNPTLWMWNTTQLAAQLRPWDAAPDTLAVVITDPEGHPISPWNEVPASSLPGVWGHTTVRVHGRPVAIAWVAKSLVPIQNRTLVFLAFSLTLGLVIAALLMRLSGRERRIVELSARALSAQEEERRRIARDLHDGPGQALCALRLQLELLRGPGQPMTEATALTDAVTEELRVAVRQLSARILDDLGLVGAIRRLAEETAAMAGLHLTLALPDQDLAPSPSDGACFRVAQEALTNVSRHADASRLDLTLEARGGRLRLSVRDNGRGFQPSQPSSGAGVRGMRERAELAGGTLKLTSSPGRGTTVRLDVPRGVW